MEEAYSLSKAIKSIPKVKPNSELYFKYFQIVEELDQKLNDLSFRHRFNKTCTALIIFQSTCEKHGSKIFWKIKGQEGFFSIEIPDDSEKVLTKICQDFLLEEIKKDENGIFDCAKDKETFDIRDIGCSNKGNLLTFVVTKNEPNILKKLLEYDFDIDFSFEPIDESLCAIDIAWKTYISIKNSSENISDKKASNEIILTLLNANSKFPKNFNYNKASVEVKNFVDECEVLHEFVTDKNLDGLESEICLKTHLCYFYDRNNQSLCAQALNSKNLNFLMFLLGKGITFGNHENEKRESMYKELGESELNSICDSNENFAKKLPKNYILVLLSNPKIPIYNRRDHEYCKYLEAMYEVLDEPKNYPCSIILKLVAAVKNLQIHYDFNYDSTSNFNPNSSSYIRGKTFSTGVIHIAAKKLLKDNTKLDVYGTTIHEFCHLAIRKTFWNNSFPYPMGNRTEWVRELRHKYIEVVKECQKNQKFEVLIAIVFKNKKNDMNKFHKELIVRPVHIIMNYYDNMEKIDECEKKFPKLFDYFRKFVVPEFEKSLPVLKMLQDDDEEVEFTDLTNPMKEKIFNKQIYFQGVKTSIFSIIKNNEDILELIPSDDIKDILLDWDDFRLGKICNATLKDSFMHREFINTNHHIKGNYKFKQIKNKAAKSKIFILSGKAGEGKTTIFENMTRKLKKCNKNFWVSYIKLRKFRDYFSEYSSLNQELSLDEICELFCKIVFSGDENKPFEVEIFKKLFNTGSVILLLDGIDEISPEFNEFIISILHKLREESRNQLFISTRPQHVKQIQRILKNAVFKLKPFDVHERSRFIRIIIKNYTKNGTHVAPIDEQKTFKVLTRFFNNFADFNNPMLIKIVTKLYIDGKIDLQSQFIDHFRIYKNLIEKQMEVLEKKIMYEDRNYFSELKMLFHVLALRIVFRSEYGKYKFNLNDLAIMDEWEDEKETWLAETIQRFGIVNVDLDFLDTNDKSSIDFNHRTFAEYFVTDFIVNNIFKKKLRDEEIENIFTILKITLYEKHDLTFLSSYMKNQSNVQNKKLHFRMKKLIEKEMEDILKKTPNNENLNNLIFWRLFLKNEQSTLRKLRDTNDNINIYKKFIECHKQKEHAVLVDILKCLVAEWGEKWYETLKINLEKLKVNNTGKNNTNDLTPSIEWFSQYKTEKIINDLKNDLFKYLEAVMKKYKEYHYPIKKLNSKFGVPTTSFLLLFRDKKFPEVLTNSPNELSFFSKIVKKSSSDVQNHRDFIRIANEMRTEHSVSDEFFSKLCEEEIFPEILKCIEEQKHKNRFSKSSDSSNLISESSDNSNLNSKSLDSSNLSSLLASFLLAVIAGFHYFTRFPTIVFLKHVRKSNMQKKYVNRKKKCKNINFKPYLKKNLLKIKQPQKGRR